MYTLPTLPRSFIRRVSISGYRAVPHHEVLTVDLAPLTLFIGDIEVGKSIVINALALLALYVVTEGKHIRFKPSKDLFGGQGMPAYIVARFDPEVLASALSLASLSKIYRMQDAIQILQQIEQIRPRVAAFFDTVSLELSPQGSIEFAPFIDALAINARAEGGLRRATSSRAPDILNVTPAVLKALKMMMMEKVDYMPTLFKELRPRYQGVPLLNPLDPTSYYFHLLLFEYPANEEFRERLRLYLRSVLPYDGIRVSVSIEDGQPVLEIQLLDRMRGEWRPLDVCGIATSYALPQVISLARAEKGSLVLIDSLGIALSPARAYKLGKLLVDVVQQGAQVVASTGHSEVVKGVIERASELPPGSVAIYVVTRAEKGFIRAYRVRERLPITGPPEVVEALEQAGFADLLKA